MEIMPARFLIRSVAVGRILLALTALLRPQLLVRARPPTWLFGVALGVLWLWNIGFNPTFHQLLLG